jgi:hypothetical protein
MKIEAKLNELINSEIQETNGLEGEKETLLLNVLAMVQTLDKDYKLRCLANVIQKSFPEYGKVFKND